MQSEAPYVADSGNRENAAVVLCRPISALQVVEVEQGGFRWGPVVKLSIGAQLRFCGPGFNGTTIKVSVGDLFYFVYRDDFNARGENLLKKERGFWKAASKSGR